MSFEDFCSFNNIVVTTARLRGRVKSFVYYDSNEFHIIINDQLSHKQSLKTLKHELMHVVLDHFESGLTVDEIEDEVMTKINEFEFCFN